MIVFLEKHETAFVYDLSHEKRPPVIVGEHSFLDQIQDPQTFIDPGCQILTKTFDEACTVSVNFAQAFRNNVSILEQEIFN